MRIMRNNLSSAWQSMCFSMVLFCLSILAPSFAADAYVEFDTEEQAALYLHLTKTHRCLKCQNQNLADSSAGIAEDLKREIYQRVKKGESGDEISAFLVSRYGDFVKYKPPFNATTYALWLGPFLLLIASLWYAVRLSRHRGQRNEPDNDALARARKLMDE